MDSSEKPFTAVEWCAGYAGIHLGLQRVIPNLRVIAFSEIEAFACANLVAKMEAGLLEPAPIWPNLKTFPSAAFTNKVDLLVAGYPCQPFSHAGKRAGTEDERHLWPYIADGIRAIRPRFCFFENVEGHITLGLSTVISDLAEMGYKTTWGIFSASEVGAPHQRKRVFILANAQGENFRGLPIRTGTEQPSTGKSSADELAYSINEGLQRCGITGENCEEIVRGHESAYGGTGQLCGVHRSVWPSRPGQPQYEWEPPRVVEQSNRGRPHINVPIGQSNIARVETKTPRTSDRKSPCSSRCQTQPALGGDANGTTDRMDDAELYGATNPRADYARQLVAACDNRVDELRLLGNGVVPATAARAWEVLYRRLI